MCGAMIVRAVLLDEHQRPTSAAIVLDPAPPVFRVWPSGCLVNSSPVTQAGPDAGAMTVHHCPRDQ